MNLKTANSKIKQQEAARLAEIEQALDLFFDVLPDSDLEIIADDMPVTPYEQWLVALGQAITGGLSAAAAIEQYHTGLEGEQ